MKILQINKFFYKKGGAEQHYFDLMKLLEDHGQEVVQFSMQSRQNEKSKFAKFFVSHMDIHNSDQLDFIQKIKNAGRIFYSFEAKRKLEKLLKKHPIDIAHIHNIYHHISPSILSVLKKHNIPVVMTIHDYKLFSPEYKFYHHGKARQEQAQGWYLNCIKTKCVNDSLSQSIFLTLEMIFHHKIMRYYERYVDFFIAPSEYVRSIFLKYGWTEDKIKVLPNFLSSDLPRVDKVIQPPKEPHFVYVGRLSEEKGVEKLVKYWYDNQLSYPLDIYGSGHLEKRIRILIKTNPNIPVNIVGFVPREKLLNALKDVTAVVIPSLMPEPFGLTAIEAFAIGIPVVVSGSGALSGMVEKSQAGVIFDLEKKGSLERALQVVGDTEFRNHAVEYMKKNHDPEQYYLNLYNMYENLIKKN